MRRLILIVGLSLLLAGQGWAETVNFYVDSAATAGGDGTTIALTGANAAWSTLAAIAWTGSIKTAVDAGKDVIINFKRGGTWTAKLTIGYSGTGAANPIVLQPYGTGTSIPTIAVASAAAVNLNGKNYITFNGLKFYSVQGGLVYVQNNNAGIIFNSCILDTDTLYNAGGQYLCYTEGTSTVTFNNCDLMRGYYAVNATATSNVSLYNCRIYGTLIPFAKAVGATITYDYCHIAGYRTTTTAIVGTDGGHNYVGGIDSGGNYTSANGIINVKNIWRYGNKYFNISIDDCTVKSTYLDDLVTAMSAYGKYPTLNIISGWVGAADWTNLLAYGPAGCELASHSWSHQIAALPELFTIRYVGAGAACTMTISGNHLVTTVDGVQDLDLDMSPPVNPWTSTNPYDMVGGSSWVGDKIVAYIDGLANYTCVKHANVKDATLTSTAADVTNQDIKTAGYLVQADPDRLFTSQCSMSRTAMGIKIADWNGRTFVVPAGDYAATGLSIIQTYFDGGRYASETLAATLKTGGVDASKISVPATNLGTTEDSVVAYAKGMVYSAGMSGEVLPYFSHQTGGYTAAQWGYFVEGALQTGAEYTTLDAITAYIRSQTETGVGTHIYLGTTDTLDMRPTGAAVTVGAGSATYAPTSDVVGTAFKSPPSIGAYEYQSTGGGGLSLNMGLGNQPLPYLWRH